MTNSVRFFFGYDWFMKLMYVILIHHINTFLQVCLKSWTNFHKKRGAKYWRSGCAASRIMYTGVLRRLLLVQRRWPNGLPCSTTSKTYTSMRTLNSQNVHIQTKCPEIPKNGSYQVCIRFFDYFIMWQKYRQSLLLVIYNFTIICLFLSFEGQCLFTKWKRSWTISES